MVHLRMNNIVLDQLRTIFTIKQKNVLFCFLDCRNAKVNVRSHFFIPFSTSYPIPTYHYIKKKCLGAISTPKKKGKFHKGAKEMCQPTIKGLVFLNVFIK